MESFPCLKQSWDQEGRILFSKGTAANSESMFLCSDRDHLLIGDNSGGVFLLCTPLAFQGRGRGK